MLHTINKSPFQHTSLEDCLRFVQAGDTVLLLEDGVYAAIDGTNRTHLISEALARCEVCALDADIAARGLDHLVPGVTLIDYDGFVALVENHKTQQAWI